MNSSKNIIKQFLAVSTTKQLFSYGMIKGRRQNLMGLMAMMAVLFFSAALLSRPALAGADDVNCDNLTMPFPEPADQKNCEWYHEQTIVHKATLGGAEQKAFDQALDALLNALDAATDEVAAVKEAIKQIGPGGDVVDVVLIYACRDNDGNIHRKKFVLDNTENVLWADKMSKAGGTELTRQRNVAIAKHKPQGSCCSAKTSSSNTQPKDDSKPKGVRSGIGSTGMGSTDSATLTGTVTLEMKTDKGSVRVILPDDIRAGDTITGTVSMSAPGNIVEGEVVQIKTVEGEVVATKKIDPSGNTPLTFSVPPGASSLVLSCTGKHIKDAIITVKSSPSTGTVPTQPGSFTPPRLGQTGRDISIPGNFDGNAANTSVNVGGKQLPVIAESPRKAVVQIPADTPTGPGNITIKENGPGNNSQTAPFNVVSLQMNADKLNLMKGEKTNLHVSVTGLEGLKDNSGNIKLRVENVSPQTVSLTFSPAFQQTGNAGTLLTRAVDLDGGNTVTFTEQVTGVSPGAFTITATLFCPPNGNFGPATTSLKDQLGDIADQKDSAANAVNGNTKAIKKLRENAEKLRKWAKDDFNEDGTPKDKEDLIKKLKQEKEDLEEIKKSLSASNANAIAKIGEAIDAVDKAIKEAGK